MTTRDVVLIALFAALIAVLGIVPPLPTMFLPVPITLQALGVMLAGAYLGPVRGLLAAALVIAIALMGIPLLSGGRGGLVVLAGPTVGFLLGWMPAAFVTGLMATPFHDIRRPAWTRFLGLFGACMVGGIVVDYACGIAGLAAITGLPFGTAAFGTLLFIPGDLVKAALAAWIVLELTRVLPAGR